MHLEILIEDRSGCRLLEHLLPKLLGPNGTSHSWRLHPYRGLGHIPKGLKQAADPSRRVLLDRLPSLLKGYGKSPGVDAVLVVVDTDQRDCAAFLLELRAVAEQPGAHRQVLFRLAIEEIEAWYLGDRTALKKAYPILRSKILTGYIQDSVCGTWELLASAIGGQTSLTGRAAGQLKHEWADRIGALLDPDANLSPSFQKLRDGIRRLVLSAEGENVRPSPS